MIKILKGARLVSIADEKIVINKEGKEFIIEIECEDDGYCGYAKVVSELLIDEKELNRNPFITDVRLTDSEEVEYSSETIILTLLGEYKPLASLTATAGSGSGWNYGACVTLKCKALNINNSIVSY